MKMKLEYDKDADAAYVYLEYPVKKGMVKNTIEINENLIVDYDGEGKLIGIEILDASTLLNKKVLESAVTI